MKSEICGVRTSNPDYYRRIRKKISLKYKEGKYMKNVTREDIYASGITGAYFDYLRSLLQGDIKRAEKYTKLRWSETMKGDVKTMTGFGEAIYQRGIRLGEERGHRLGEEIGLRHGELKKARETALSMAEDGMEIKRIARLLKVSEDDIRNWMEENRLLVK